MQEDIHKILQEAKVQGASDIHITLESNFGLIRFRVKGQMRTYEEVKLREYSRLVNYLKFMADLDINEHRMPQSGRTFVNVDNEQIGIRVSTLPITMMNEIIVIRLLLSTNHLKELELFTTEDEMDFLKNYMQKSQGLILFTGPTGSGKTTLMYQLIQKEIEDSRRQIISIEDPIEYDADYMVQVEINEKTEMNYENLLRGAMRCDPDIILFGEIRSRAIAAELLRASLSGHLVLSTFHSKSAKATIDRLMDYGLLTEEIKQSVSLIVNQRIIHTEGRSFIIYEYITEEDIHLIFAQQPVKSITLQDRLKQLKDEGILNDETYQTYIQQFQ